MCQLRTNTAPFPTRVLDSFTFSKNKCRNNKLKNNSKDRKIEEQLEKIVRLVIVAFQAAGHGVTQPQPHLCGLPRPDPEPFAHQWVAIQSRRESTHRILPPFFILGHRSFEPNLRSLLGDQRWG
jgi:hypothetical protein